MDHPTRAASSTAKAEWHAQEAITRLKENPGDRPRRRIHRRSRSPRATQRRPRSRFRGARTHHRDNVAPSALTRKKSSAILDAYSDRFKPAEPVYSKGESAHAPARRGPRPGRTAAHPARHEQHGSTGPRHPRSTARPSADQLGRAAPGPTPRGLRPTAGNVVLQVQHRAACGRSPRCRQPDSACTLHRCATPGRARDLVPLRVSLQKRPATACRVRAIRRASPARRGAVESARGWHAPCTPRQSSNRGGEGAPPNPPAPRRHVDRRATPARAMPATAGRAAPLGLARSAPAVAAQPGRPARAWLQHRAGASPRASCAAPRGWGASVRPALRPGWRARFGAPWPGLGGSPRTPHRKTSGGGALTEAARAQPARRTAASARLRRPSQHLAAPRPAARPSPARCARRRAGKWRHTGTRCTRRSPPGSRCMGSNQPADVARSPARRRPRRRRRPTGAWGRCGNPAFSTASTPPAPTHAGTGVIFRVFHSVAAPPGRPHGSSRSVQPQHPGQAGRRRGSGSAQELAGSPGRQGSLRAR